MLFNSIQFAVFLPIVFALHWIFATRNYKFQNILLLVSSYFFYACWDWRFMFLLMFSTLVDYFAGLKLHAESSSSKRKMWLWISIGINLGFLSIFKYYDFFAENFAASMAYLGFKVNISSLNIILPVGISFYTFHGLSYILDVYKNKIKPEKNFATYAVFVSFFPLLVAGPIERATHLLPQLIKRREFDYSKAINGLRQILWGLFKKIVIADNCAVFANHIFNNSDNYSGIILILGAVFFAFQIYGDFSGYSDIAIGVARLFGIDLLRNFAFPYFSRDIAEFWRRWHISLSSWFRDYVYIPMGGSRGSLWQKVKNTFIVFLISGFWHGANWTFIVWGGLNALFIMPSVVFNTNRKNLDIVAQGKLFPSIKEILSMFATFCATLFAWIFFRANNVDHALQYISNIFIANSFFTIDFYDLNSPLPILLIIFIFVTIEWFGREKQYAIEAIGIKKNRVLRWSFYYIIAFVIYYFAGNQQQFIYFQF
jgi:D-alanyl-lipoteichoic acid acyltransferase DltB (MBOAT superfamily)